MEQTIIILAVLQAVFFVAGALLADRQARKWIADLVDQAFSAPMVKGAMSTLGKKSGEVRHDAATFENLAGQILNNENLSGIKMVGKAFGVDVDALIQEQGASDTLKGILQLANMAGFDISSLLTGNLKSTGMQASTGENPYLRRR